jgi:outer membrane protein assembly factor BamB
MTFAIMVLVLLASAAARGGEWPSWRGPSQDGVSLEKGLPDSTKELLWQAHYGGRSAPAIFGGRVFGIDLAGEGVMEQDRVFALDLASGKTVWEYRFNVFHTDVPDTRVGWANVAVDPETGNVYAHGVEGMFLCFNRDGKLLWSKSLTELYSRLSGFGGRTNTPIIDEERVIISFVNSSFGSHAPGAHRYLAMDKRTGEVLWWSTPSKAPQDTTYSTPVVAVINGQRLIIGGNADGGIYAIKSRTGEKVWGFQLSQQGINASVVVDGYKVYASHSEENIDSTAMGRVVAIDGRGTGDITRTGEIWRAEGIDAGYASPLLHAGRLYVMCNSGVLRSLDAQSGKPIWTFVAGRVGKGSPVWGDGKIYLTTANGTFEILEDLGSRCRRLDSMSFELGEGGRGGNLELFGSPSVSEGRVVFTNTTDMFCLAKDPGPRPVAVPPLAAESPVESAPATLMVRPAEVLLEPGQSVQFEAIAYDRHGRKIGPVEAQWACVSPSVQTAGMAAGANRNAAVSPGGHAGISGKGSTIHAGKFVAGAKGAFGLVTAKSGTFVGEARVRIVPALPIAEDFESYKDGDVIGWWAGVSKAKHAIETLDGSKVLKKLSDDRGPIFNRSHVFITPPLAPGYVVEADVLGTKQGRLRGDVGLINDRYDLELFGTGQKMRVMSWIPAPRFEKKVDFHWDAGRWYRLKFEVDLVGDEARLYAKAWPRDEPEPAAWTIKAVDPQPNREGSAGIYANSGTYNKLKPVPLYYDNVKIYRPDH